MAVIEMKVLRRAVIIDGKTYYWGQGCDNLREANAIVKEFRKDGNPARIVHAEGSYVVYGQHRP